jgi:hypothetical protein
VYFLLISLLSSPITSASGKFDQCYQPIPARSGLPHIRACYFLSIRITEMSNLTRAESARINGAKSRGPKTPEGLAISSMNAVRHGITAKTLILGNELPEEFTEMLASYMDYLQPANQVEIDLVADMVAARWRLRRIWRYQTAILDVEMDSQAPDFEERFEVYDEGMRGGFAFSALSDRSKSLMTVLRYDIHLSRTYRSCLNELRLLRGKGRVGLPEKIPQICENEPNYSAE